MNVRVAYAYINKKCIWRAGSVPRLYSHFLVPKCETHAPANPPSMLSFSQVDLMVLTASSTGVGPLKWGA